MGVRSSSLLRLYPTARGSALVLVLVCATTSAAVAQAAGQAPDPSPSLSAVQPDPYPASSAPARTQAPVTIVVRPTVVRAPVHGASVVRRKPQPAVKPKAVVKAIRLPVHPAPGLGVRFTAAAVAFEPQQRVSRTLALAVALLVLVSAAFVAGAAREVAR